VLDKLVKLPLDLMILLFFKEFAHVAFTECAFAELEILLGEEGDIELCV